MYSRKTLLITLLLIITLSGASAQSQLQLETLNNDGQTVPAEYTVKNSSGIVAQAQDSLTADLATNHNYTVIQDFGTGDINVTLYELNLTEDFNPDIQLTDRKESTPYLENGEKIYGFKNTGIDFSKGEISYGRSSAPDNILKCNSYDFSSTDCSDWNINSSTDYSISQDSGIFTFNVSGFSAYTAGDTAPRLNVAEIRVYNVTGLSNSEKKYQGQLIDQGLNKTFQTEQTDQAASFRFTFQVKNIGSEDWDLASADTLYHDGIDTGWTVDQIFYNTSTEYTGGSFSSGRVTWDTGTDAVLQNGTSMNASYVTETSLTDTETFDQRFLVSDSSTAASDEDEHILEAIKYGRIDVEFISPPNNTIVTQNKTFALTANLTCSGGECGTVEANPRYNSTEGQQILPGQGEEPFALQEDAGESCTLVSGEECQLDWDVNATGSQDSYHELDVNASSNSYPGIPESDSRDFQVEISVPIDFSLNWTTIDFGALNPGVENKSAEGNDNMEYNITVSEDSAPIDNLWVNATDLVSTVDPSYVIGASNMSYSLQNDISTENRLSNSYQHVKSNIDPGDIISTFYWIDVPFGMTEGGYNGTITFKANSTS